MIVRFLTLVAVAGGLGVLVTVGVAVAHAELAAAGVQQAAAVSSYQVKFSYEKSDGNRAITTTVVQAKSSTEAQRQVKASYHKVNIITVGKL
jgi:uncharacterized membrane protein YjgN (DUF898 family)